MICASCGKQVPAGARYCVHCGAEQSAPTPIAAVAAAASMARASQVKAANAAHAEPRARMRVDAANQSPAIIGGRASAVVSAHQTVTPPAYAAGPGRRGLAIALVAGGIVVGLAAAVGWHLHESGPDAKARNEASDLVPGVQGAARASAAEALTAAASGVVETGAASPAASLSGDGARRPADNLAAPPVSTEPSASRAGATAGREAPIEIKALPPPSASARTARRAAAEKPAEPLESAATVAPPASPAPGNRTLASTSARATAASALADHWRRMADELSRCTREDFITRVICGQRVRFRYCDGYWGRATQCPANPVPERGQ
jgi:hypothetical protein